MVYKQAAVIGGGPAGMAAALSLKENGIEDIVLIERDSRLGGILPQCIHDGFGLLKFNKSLTGPEYSSLYSGEIKKTGIPVLLNSSVMKLTEDRTLSIYSRHGMEKIKAEAVVLAMGCRERAFGALAIPGSRPAGIYTAGVAQRLINLQNIMPGRNIVILGSGDIGLIMARRLTLEGAKVKVVVEKLPFAGGLPRNLRQCLDDFNIPLLLGHTIVKTEGTGRLQSVTIARLGKNGNPIAGSAEKIDCDTVLLSVGLIPENEISRNAGAAINPFTLGPSVDETGQTSIPGIFACGNVLHVHDLVDNVSWEAEAVGKAAAEYILGKSVKASKPVTWSGGIRYVLPSFVSGEREVMFSMRVKEPGKDKILRLSSDKEMLKEIRLARVNPPEMIRFDFNPAGMGLKNLTVDLLDK